MPLKSVKRCSAVEQGTADLVQITLYLARGADTLVGGVAIIATGAGVHGGDEHERTGKLYGVFGTADGDFAVFQWLAQHFECAFVELRQLITEEHAVVGEADLTGLRVGAAAD